MGSMSDEAATSASRTERAGGEAITAELLVGRYAQAVFALCLAHTRNTHDAEDAMQETFVKALTGLDSLRQPDKLRPWLLQIARRTCVDRLRRRKAADRGLTDVEPPPPADRSQVERLHGAIAGLPAETRETITLYYLDGRSTSSVAAALGISEPAVRQRLFRGRAMLHDLLTEGRT